MHSLTPDFLHRLSLPHKLIGTIRAIGHFQGKQELYQNKAPDMLRNLQQVAVIESVESSNRIENIVVKQADLLRLMRDNAEQSATWDV